MEWVLGGLVGFLVGSTLATLQTLLKSKEPQTIEKVVTLTEYVERPGTFSAVPKKEPRFVADPDTGERIYIEDSE